MSTATATYNFDISSDATFRLLYGAMETNLLAFGWTVHTDTGQTDPATATAPAVSSDAGFRVYKTNDSGTVYYVKITFGRGTGTGARWKVDVGTTTNGSGTLTGQTATQLTVTHALTSGTHALHMSGTTGRMMIATGVDSSTTSNQCGVAIGRTCDGAGADTNTGIEIWAQVGSNLPKAQLVPFSGTVGTQETAWPCAFTSRSPASQGTSVLVGIPRIASESVTASPTRFAALWDGASFTNNTTTSFTIYGATHTYLVTQMANAWAAVAAVRSMFLYE